MADVVDLTRAKRVIDRAAARKGGGYPVWVDALDLIAEPEPDREWVVDGLIERQGRILIAGSEGCGKSLLALTGAVQIAAGLPVWGSFPAGDPRRVVYLDLEMARASTRSRARLLTKQAKALGGQVIKHALVFCQRADGLDLGNRREAEGLFADVAKWEPELVVVDPLYKTSLHSLEEEKYVGPILGFLDGLRHRLGVALIIPHHLRKRAQGDGARGRDSSDIYGSSRLLRWPETIMLMNEDEMRVTKDRDATFEQTRAWRVTSGPRFPIGLESMGNTLEDQIESYIVAYGPVSATEVQTHVHRRRQVVVEAIAVLKTRGRIRKTGQKWEAV